MGRGSFCSRKILSGHTKVHVGDAVASWLVRSTPDRVVWVRALAKDVGLCSWARHFTLMDQRTGVALRWTSLPSRGK